MKQLLREFYGIDLKSGVLRERVEDGSGKLVLKGVIQRANAPNQNKRVYPREILRREADNYMKAVRENRAVGECDHPETSTVALSNVSHVVREMWWEGDDLFGKVEVLATPKGKILETLVEAGIPLGISSRGVGSTSKNESGLDTVQEDYNLICFDVVAEPSTTGAFLSEGREVPFDPRGLPRADRVYRRINDILERMRGRR